MKNCDIIIPIYNAFEYLKICLNSVLSHTDLKNNRLILIDDKSPDTRIISYIENYLNNKSENILFIKNEENLGFIKTVNKGMKYSDNDVLLLNSDTEVTDDWLKKIQKCAYSKERIATVTPLSNCATIASVPKYGVYNELPEGYSLDEYQKLIEGISYKEYPEIPTGIGFCFYIKRDVLDIVGFFDEVSYGKAYGEEEDFCYRCLGNGYKNILCDDVIVYHKSAQSLIDYYKDVGEERQKTIIKKHPYYKKNTERWVSCAPLYYINQNINYNICLDNKKNNILILLHMWDETIEGGTSFHVLDLINQLRSKYNFHILYPKDGSYCLSSYWENGSDNIYIKSLISRQFTNPFFNNDYKNLLENIINAFKIDTVHIQHLIGHYFDIVDIKKTKKIKLLLSIHDLYSICPRINKVNVKIKYCGSPDNIECCNCLKSNNNIYSNIDYIYNIDTWYNLWNLLLSNADLIITPSDSTKREILDVYKNIEIKVIEHGIDIKELKNNINKIDDNYLNIAFVGHLAVHKGKYIIEKLINYGNKQKDKILFHIFGKIDSDILKYKNKKLIYHGEYKKDDLNVLLIKNNIKIVCLFSIWPETYSYTLTESIANNIPVLTFEYGAIGERVKKNGLGWIINSDSSISEIYNKIKYILNKNDEYNNILENIKKYKIKSTSEMANEYDELYSYKIDGNNCNKNLLKIFIKENYIKNTNIVYLDSSSNNNHIYKSFTWRIGRIFTYIPGKFKMLYLSIKNNKLKDAL